MAAPIRPARKLRFFIKITISQYHDIDISYIDIDIGKNAFTMTTLVHRVCYIVVNMVELHSYVAILSDSTVYFNDYHFIFNEYIQN